MSEDSNVKLGNKTLEKNVNLGNNTGLGNESLVENKEGFQNTSVGALSLNKNEDGYNNIAVGYKALENSKNNNNSALGARSGETLVNGKSNVLIGKEADVSKKNAKNQIVIGANAKGDDDNSVTLGNSEVTKVNMSESKNAEVNCGQVNVYNLEGKKSYSLPNSDGKKNQIIKTDGKGNLRWTNDNKGSGGSTSISNNPPTVSDRSGNAGDLRYDDNYLYICLGNNNWTKTALTTIIYDWIQLGANIDGEAAGDWSGWSVSLSGDGSRVAIGAYRNDGRTGHVRIYDYNGSAWTQVGTDIDGEALNDESGYSVSLSSDGSRVAIGARYNDGDVNDNRGHTRIYDYDGSAWVQVGTDIDGEAADDNSGYSVSLSSDGSKVAIGATHNDGNGDRSGHTRIYEYSNNSWTQLGTDIDGEASNDKSGNSVSLNSDGSRVAIGAPGNFSDNQLGYTRIYDWNGSAWTQVGNDIDGEASNDQSGQSVSLSADGSIVAIGAHRNENYSKLEGHVRIYEYKVYTDSDVNNYYYESRIQDDTQTLPLIITENTTTEPVVGNSYWMQLGLDIDGELQIVDNYSGYNVSLSNDGTIVAIGAYYNDGGNDGDTDEGHTRIYEYKVYTDSDVNNYYYESRVQNSSQTLPLIITENFTTAPVVGNSYWMQLRLDIDGEVSRDKSGWSVSLSGDGTRVAIGATWNDGTGSYAGHTRIYELKFE